MKNQKAQEEFLILVSLNNIYALVPEYHKSEGMHSSIDSVSDNSISEEINGDAFNNKKIKFAKQVGLSISLII